uniref:Ig-like domain-containing protein n=1 Tax=Syphacia muris TaxID=451379 RepID=A0A0N5AT13_9BILA
MFTGTTIICRTVFVCFVIICGSLCCSPDSFPNNTANALHLFDCTPENQTKIVDIKWLQLKSDKTNLSYPINVSNVWSLKLQITNHGKKIDNLLMDVTCYQWKMDEKLKRCSWQPLFTFGLTDDLEVCEWIDCPLEANTTVNAEVKFDAVEYASLIDPGLYSCHADLKNNDKPRHVKLADFVPPPLGCSGYQSIIEV